MKVNFYCLIDLSMPAERTIQLIAAPSILGLRPTGVEKLPEALLKQGLKEKLNSKNPVVHVPVFNNAYDPERSKTNFLLNEQTLLPFSLSLSRAILQMSRDDIFPLVLGGDCSILIGIMAALKSKSTYGLIFCDAHADFYLPEQSTTGEAADMDLALVTGRGPDSLTDLGDLRPYVKDEHVFHIGQRDAEEAKRYGSQAIQDTAIHCFDWPLFRDNDSDTLIDTIVNKANALKLDGYWLHFDTDVLSDDENPAVDYRLPGGFSFAECEHLLKKIVASVPVAGMSVTIFNPSLDRDGRIASRLVQCMERVFSNE